MGTTSAYGYVNTANTVDGQLIQGLWDGDDAISIAPLGDKGTMLIGADGSALFSVSANRGATITLRLMHTSPTHRLLTQKLKRQQALASSVAAFPVTAFDTSSGEGGTGDKCFIQSAPTDSKGTNATVREWVLVTGEWNPEIPNG
ncbi:phage protein [Shinella sp. DD12]|uniref:phage structural protein n=1 Tax=Shinella sp. DD12 TaxID=1410620 RepID=UPI0003C53056|nr:phage protein [Shinella sp. DD12]EYR81385.1 putative structural protein [Shinella sp. DD12]